MPPSASCRLVEAVFLGIKAAVLVIVIEALLRIAKRALKQPVHWMIAALAFVAIFFLALPFPLIVAGGCALRLLVDDAAPRPRPSRRSHCRPARLPRRCAPSLIWLVDLDRAAARARRRVRPRPRADAARAGSSPSSRWSPSAAPMPCSPTWARTSSPTTAGSTPAQMMDGLGLAETTPGPLILVTEFVGYLAAYPARRRPGLADGPARRARGAVGDVRAVLPVDLRRRALHRVAQRPAAAQGRAAGDHRRRRRRHPQPRGLVRAACVVRHGDAGRGRPAETVDARCGDARLAGRTAGGRSQRLLLLWRHWGIPAVLASHRCSPSLSALRRCRPQVREAAPRGNLPFIQRIDAQS